MRAVTLDKGTGGAVVFVTNNVSRNQMLVLLGLTYLYHKPRREPSTIRQTSTISQPPTFE
jgi:hypothetical protein